MIPTNTGMNLIHLSFVENSGIKPPEWLNYDLEDKWGKTNLHYQYYLGKIAELEAARRDKIPPETIRIWYMDFLRRGWNQSMFDHRFNAVKGMRTYGPLALTDWINAEVVTTAYKPVQKYTGKIWKPALDKGFQELKNKLLEKPVTPKELYKPLPPNYRADTLKSWSIARKIKAHNRVEQKRRLRYER